MPLRKKGFRVNLLSRLKKHLKSISLCVLSAVALVLAFPKVNMWLLAFGALIPFMAALDGKTLKQSIYLGFLTGFIFFSCTLYWFIYVTSFGAFLLICYLSVYFILFAVGYYISVPLKSMEKIFVLPCLWVLAEYARAHFFSGFDWASLGHSQFQNVHLIQIADWAGVYGVSFIVFMCNTAAKEALFSIKPLARQEKACIISVVAALLTGVLGYGQFRINEENRIAGNIGSKGKLSAALIQANIEQEKKWDKKFWPEIMEHYVDLSRQAALMEPDIIIWPETAFPGFLWKDIAYYARLRKFVEESNIPLLFGSIITLQDNYFNSSVLLSSSGEVLNHYHKIHLVPFGEFVPLRSKFPTLAGFIPIEDFKAGNDLILFSIPPSGHYFSTLICFEDTVAGLARRFVLEGSQLLVNITNDAWFKDTKAPFLHLQSSIFRSVENRRYLIRAANTGVSAVVNPLGEIVDYVADQAGKLTYIEGVSKMEAQFRNQITFYTQFGNIFVLGCLAYVLGLAGATVRRRKKYKY